MRRNVITILILALVLGFLVMRRMERDDGRAVILVTTTSTQDSGLLDRLTPVFESRTGFILRTIAVGTGQALAMGARGEADVALVHAPELELDPARLDQEVVIYADRMDVTEETVRLQSHLEQFRETLDEQGPVGRKLEFLLQELGREVNTIGSKVSEVPITRHVIEMKTELEKLREQVLNVE